MVPPIAPGGTDLGAVSWVTEQIAITNHVSARNARLLREHGIRRRKPMKLIYCPECLDMKKLQMLRLRRCTCGKAWGYYLDDDLTAEIGGTAVPIAIENDELREAVLRRPPTGMGIPLQGRVLPLAYDTLRWRRQPNLQVQTDAS